MADRIYDERSYFEGDKDKPEHQFWPRKMLRWGDQVAAIAYAFGLDTI